MQAEVKDAFWALFDTEEVTTKPGPELVELVDHRITDMAARYSNSRELHQPRKKPQVSRSRQGPDSVPPLQAAAV